MMWELVLDWYGDANTIYRAVLCVCTGWWFWNTPKSLTFRVIGVLLLGLALSMGIFFLMQFFPDWRAEMVALGQTIQAAALTALAICIWKKKI